MKYVFKKPLSYIIDGIAVNCITHYANEQVGPEIEWDDDIDINYHDSTTEQWDKYFEKLVMKDEKN